MKKNIIIKFSLILATTILATGLTIPVSNALGSTKNTSSNNSFYSNTSIINTNEQLDNTESNKSDLQETPIESEVNKILLKKAPDYISDKKDLFNIMLNSIDYYNTISGKLIDKTNQSTELTVEFAADMLNQISYENCYNSEFNIENYYEYDQLTRYNNVEKNYTKHNYSSPRTIGCMDNEDRITISDDGYNCYLYRERPVSTSLSNICIQSQELTFSFLGDFSLWDTSGKEKYLDRDCYIIEGKTQDYYNEKLNISSFKFLVDSKTGILLKFEGYDSNGNLSKYMSVSEISIDSTNISDICVEKMELNKNLYKSYSSIQSYS